MILEAERIQVDDLRRSSGKTLRHGTKPEIKEFLNDNLWKCPGEGKRFLNAALTMVVGQNLDLHVQAWKSEKKEEGWICERRRMTEFLRSQEVFFRVSLDVRPAHDSSARSSSERSM